MKILALDLGKSKSAVCILDTAEMKERYTTVGTTPFELTILLERQRPDRVVLEVGTLSGWVHDVAVRQGCMVQVANPNHEGWRWRNVKRKSDRLDALKLARLSAAGQLPMVHMPANSVREHRALIQYRSQLVGRRTRIKNTIRSLVARQGRGMASGAAGWTQVEMDKLRQWARPWDQADGEASCTRNSRPWSRSNNNCGEWNTSWMPWAAAMNGSCDCRRFHAWVRGRRRCWWRFLTIRIASRASRMWVVTWA
jgi:hypothetical protein